MHADGGYIPHYRYVSFEIHNWLEFNKRIKKRKKKTKNTQKSIELLTDKHL